jgi:NADH:ubiquinone oxidoreductase subunit D
MDRTVGVGQIAAAEAINWGFTGPCLRACGVAHDLRRANPYMLYERFAFDIPVGQQGDTYDRYVVRMEEMRQSLRILHQLAEQLPGGPVNASNPQVVMPPKERVYTSIEGLISQFELVMKGVQPPPGEVYVATEAANGELGFYIISDGSGHPYRVRVRPPCFPILSALPHMIKGRMIADLISALGSINVIAGELDR